MVETQTQEERQSATPCRIVLVDDHPILRRGLRETFEDQAGFEICGEALDLPGAMEVVARSKPDVVVIDISLEESNGLHAISEIIKKHPDIRILVYSMHDEDLYAERALRAGAHGYVGKSESPDRLVDSIRTVHEGGTAVSETITDRLLKNAVGRQSDSPTGIASLSDREIEVFQLIGEGMNTRRIAKRLSLSIKTIETHRENIKRKLEIDDAAELARHAVSWVETSPGTQTNA